MLSKKICSSKRMFLGILHVYCMSMVGKAEQNWTMLSKAEQKNLLIKEDVPWYIACILQVDGGES